MKSFNQRVRISAFICMGIPYAHIHTHTHTHTQWHTHLRMHMHTHTHTHVHTDAQWHPLHTLHMHKRIHSMTRACTCSTHTHTHTSCPSMSKEMYLYSKVCVAPYSRAELMGIISCNLDMELLLIQWDRWGGICILIAVAVCWTI